MLLLWFGIACETQMQMKYSSFNACYVNGSKSNTIILTWEDSMGWIGWQH